MTVWVVTVNNRINSVWANETMATAHMRRLIEINGDQLAVKARDFEVRDTDVRLPHLSSRGQAHITT